MLSNRKPTPEKIREDLLRTARELERILTLDPNCNAAKRRAAFYERCKTSDTKLHVETNTCARGVRRSKW
jgi:hypothetical protein